MPQIQSFPTIRDGEQSAYVTGAFQKPARHIVVPTGFIRGVIIAAYCTLNAVRLEYGYAAT